jgi:hypothetical protein
MDCYLSSRYSRGRLILAVLMLTALAGCGSRLRPVEGQVVFTDGKPLPGGMVIFEQVTSSGPRVAARGDIGPDGTFRLSTYAQDDGVPEGNYRVAVAPPLPADVRQLSGARMFPEKYENPETSGLQFQVTSGKNVFQIKLDRR